MLAATDNAGRLPSHVAPAWGRTVLRFGLVGPTATRGTVSTDADADTLSEGGFSVGADTCSTTVSDPVSVSRCAMRNQAGPYDSLLALLQQLSSASVIGDPRVERAMAEAATSIQAAVSDLRSSVVSGDDLSADSAMHLASSAIVADGGAAKLVEECARVRSLHAYDAFSRTHELEDGSFYVVHDGQVVETPFPSREAALQFLRQSAVNIDDVLVMEAGSDWDTRNDTLCLAQISTSSRASAGIFEPALVNVALKHNSLGVSSSAAPARTGAGGAVCASALDSTNLSRFPPPAPRPGCSGALLPSGASSCVREAESCVTANADAVTAAFSAGCVAPPLARPRHSDTLADARVAAAGHSVFRAAASSLQHALRSVRDSVSSIARPVRAAASSSAHSVDTGTSAP